MKHLRLYAPFAALLVAAASFAHHSFAVFDMAKTETYEGTVKEVQWTNPHVWVSIDMTEGGATKTWSFECGAIAVLKRNGWTRDLVKPGDPLKIIGHPYRDGRPGGSVDRAILADGREIRAGDGLPSALRPPGAE